MDKVGNLVRLLEKPEGLEDFSVLEWFLITGEDTIGNRFSLKRRTGLQFFAEKANMGKEYDFRTFELGTADELAEFLVNLNLKMDIRDSVTPYSQPHHPLPYSPPSYTVATPITYGPGGYTSSFSGTATTGLSGISTAGLHNAATSSAQQEALKNAMSHQAGMWEALKGKLIK